jgi:hypothetical protein
MHSFKLAGRLILHHDLFRRGSFEPSPTTGDAILLVLRGTNIRCPDHMDAPLARTWRPHQPTKYTTQRDMSTALRASCSLPTYVHGPEITARDDDVTSNDTLYLVHDR